MGYLFDGEKRYSDDYHLALIKNIRYVNNAWSTSEYNWKKKLGFWCLNPGVIFTQLSEQAHSVVLASGTMSPLDSFASELQSPFSQKFEANHVITPDQAFVCVVETGPKHNQSLLGTFQNAERFSYQDDLGLAILSLVGSLPAGVLCFLPSYNTLDRLIKRWQSSGIWDKIADLKQIFIEPKSITEFEEVLSDYNKAAHGTGALMFGVYRGKISEGIDFSDDSARGVIAIGIPYPNIKDIQVDLKKQYNDRLTATNGLLSGKQWYEAQAFRAYNQALGRCLRHKNDWGCIVMLDSRLSQQRNLRLLSKWVRSQARIYKSFAAAEADLKTFLDERAQI